MRFLALCLLALTVISSPAIAQGGGSGADAVKDVAKHCPSKWESQKCLAAVSGSNLIMAASYGEALTHQGHETSVEQVKGHCAASTAATKGEYPAAAMRSAYVECANALVDISGATGVNPDPTLYQVLVGAVMCLDKNASCPTIEQGLKNFR